MAPKKLLLALLVASALAVPELAWAPSFDVPLHDNAGFEINVDTSGAGSAALTITYLNRQGTKIRTMQTITVPAGERVQYFIGKIPKNSTSRIFIDVEPVGNNTVSVEVEQPGVVSHSQTCNGDCRMTLHVVPAP